MPISWSRRFRAPIAAAGLMALLSLPGGDGAMAADEPLWPDSFLTRVEALALIQGLNADLLASRSATLTLEAWCRTHRLADPPTVVAHLDRTVDKPATAEQRRRLEVADDEPVRFRRVRLYCGDKLLSEADNWYVPGRLTVGMNQILDSTDTPFGKAVLELGPTRQTFAAKMLWSPLPDGWERAPVPASSPGRSWSPTPCSSIAPCCSRPDGYRFPRLRRSISGSFWLFPRHRADRLSRPAAPTAAGRFYSPKLTERVPSWTNPPCILMKASAVRTASSRAP